MNQDRCVSLVLLKFRSTVPNRFNYLDISNEVANQNLYMLVFFKGNSYSSDFIYDNVEYAPNVVLKE